MHRGKGEGRASEGSGGKGISDKEGEKKWDGKAGKEGNVRENWSPVLILDFGDGSRW